MTRGILSESLYEPLLCAPCSLYYVFGLPARIGRCLTIFTRVGKF